MYLDTNLFLCEYYLVGFCLYRISRGNYVTKVEDSCPQRGKLN